MKEGMDPYKLYEAAKSGDIESLHRIVEEDAADVLILQKTPKDSSILHIAAEFKQEKFFEEVVDLCPKKKSLIEHANYAGETALHVAAREGSTEVVDFIIAHTKRLYRDTEEGPAVEGYKELLRMVNRDGENALHMAAQYGHFDVANSLVQADPQLAKYVNQAGQSPCFMATVRQNMKILELLLSLDPPYCSLRGDSNGMTALHAAVLSRSSPDDIMKIIVSKRAEMIREGDAIGWTPLHYAAFYGKVDAVEILLKQDPSAVYLMGKEGESAIHIAAFNGHINVMEVLIRTRPDCWDLVNKKTQTALHAAVLGDQSAVVKYILGFSGRKSIVFSADEDGNTPLHLAALDKNIVIVAFFSKGTSINSYETSLLFKATNKQNLTASEICGYGGTIELFYTKNLKAELNEEAAMGLQRIHERAIYQRNKMTEDEHRLRRPTTVNKEDGIESESLNLTATLIATVTFAAGFTMPGGYNQSGGPNEGMAVLASKAAFQAFVIFDVLAFFTAMMVVYLQLRVSTKDRRSKLSRLLKSSEIVLAISIATMGLAFTCGIYAVLVKSGSFGLSALIVSAYFSLVCLGVYGAYQFKNKVHANGALVG